MVKKFKGFLHQNKWLIIFLIVSFIPLGDLLHPGLFVAHDTQDHVARIANFYQNLLEGNVIPRWAGNLNWGYGHPILMFLYPLPSYVASLFHFLGLSLVDSTKIVFALGFVLSGVTMFFWIREFLGEKAGFVSSLLYMFAPYRFVDLYVRGAIGENFFFIWPPLVCYFFLKLSKNIKSSTIPILQSMVNENWKYIVAGSFSLAAMILSHNALTLMFLPFIVIYAFFILTSREKISLYLSISLSFFLGLNLSAFFWLPAFFEGKYTLRDIVTKGEYAKNFESLGRLIYSPWNYGGTGQFGVQLGVIQWVVILLAPAVAYCSWRRIKRKSQSANVKTSAQNLKLLIFSYFIFWLAIFLILPISQPVYEKLTILQKFQFPWRWLSLAIFPPAISAGLIIKILPTKWRLFSVFSILLFSLLLNKDYWHVKDYLYKPESFYTGIYPGTTDTGESAPIWSVRFMEKEPRAYFEVVEGEADLTTVSRKIIRHVYKVNIKSEKARLLENTLYFPGWFIYVDGQKTEVEFQDPNHRGLMTFWVDKGEHSVIVAFRETKLRQAADIISAASVFGFLFIGLIIRLPKLKIKS